MSSRRVTRSGASAKLSAKNSSDGTRTNTRPTAVSGLDGNNNGHGPYMLPVQSTQSGFLRRPPRSTLRGKNTARSHGSVWSVIQGNTAVEIAAPAKATSTKAIAGEGFMARCLLHAWKTTRESGLPDRQESVRQSLPT